MKRFFGMMPRDEVEVEKIFIDKKGLLATIQAGVNGWTVIYESADCSSKYQDMTCSTEENFNVAYSILINDLGEVNPKYVKR